MPGHAVPESASKRAAPQTKPRESEGAERVSVAELSNQDASPGLGTDLRTGLTETEAARRLEQFGPNALAEERASPLLKFLSFFWGPIPWMIEVAAVLSAAVQRWEDFTIIVIMLLINAGVGFWEEFKADNAIAALKKTLALKAHVLRDGAWRDIAARGLVSGDAILVR